MRPKYGFKKQRDSQIVFETCCKRFENEILWHVFISFHTMKMHFLPRAHYGDYTTPTYYCQRIQFDISIWQHISSVCSFMQKGPMILSLIEWPFP